MQKTRRILALALPWFPAERILRRHPALKYRPFVLSEEKNGRRIVAACNPAAARAGYAPGLAIADARAIEPDLPVFEKKAEADTAALSQLALWAGRYTPYAAPAEKYTLFLDISGCEHLHGDEKGLAADAIARLAALGFTVLAGIADTPGAAWALAHYGRRDGAIDILPPLAAAEKRTRLGALSIEALRLETGTALALADFGLQQVADLYAIARADLTARFGPLPALRLDQLLGREKEPISPLAPLPDYAVEERFPEPLSGLPAMERVLDRLLDRLCPLLLRDGRGASRLAFTGFAADGQVIEVTAGASRPARDAVLWSRLFREKLSAFTREVGYDVLRLGAPETAPLAAAQADWQGERADMAALAPLIDRLGNRFGFRKLQRQEIAESWWPERAVTRHSVASSPSARLWPQARSRPLRLFRVPAPILVTAPMPDDPPLHFRWQGRLYRVRAADGPERLLPEWWREDGRPRDYYRVEDEAGRRFWLYREGLFSEGEAPRWFLHGIFA